MGEQAEPSLSSLSGGGSDRVAPLIISRWMVSGFRRNSVRGVHGTAFTLQQAALLSVYLNLARWAALGYAIWKYVP